MTTSSTFDNQVRFNWGYHDAAFTVREGWDSPKDNYGFYHHGLLATVTPETLLRRHHDASYARGWLLGLEDARNGRYTGNSGDAWDRAVMAGQVQP